MIRFYDKQDYEEKYGEEVGSCNRHKITVVDNNCDLCEDELGELCDYCKYEGSESSIGLLASEHRCRADVESCINGKDCEEYVEYCACKECWEEDE